jgi:hypothetical protein
MAFKGVREAFRSHKVLLAQAAVVGLLCLGAYFALLRPEHNESLFTVQTPQGLTHRAAVPSGGESTPGGRRKPSRTRHAGARTDRKATPPARRAQATPASRGSGPLIPLPTGSQGAVTPLGNQYGDAVEALLARP